MLRVGVPSRAGEAEFVPEDGDESAPRFDQPARTQARLAEDRHAVRFAKRPRFTVQIESVANARRSDQIVSQRAKMIQSARGFGTIERASGLVELCEQRLSR